MSPGCLYRRDPGAERAQRMQEGIAAVVGWHARKGDLGPAAGGEQLTVGALGGVLDGGVPSHEMGQAAQGTCPCRPGCFCRQDGRGALCRLDGLGCLL